MKDIIQQALCDADNYVAGLMYSSMMTGTRRIGQEYSDHFIVIDLDHSRNPETGEISPGVINIIREANCFAELLPSGHSIRLYVKKPPPRSGPLSKIEERIKRFLLARGPSSKRDLARGVHADRIGPKIVAKALNNLRDRREVQWEKVAKKYMLVGTNETVTEAVTI